MKIESVCVHVLILCPRCRGIEQSLVYYTRLQGYYGRSAANVYQYRSKQASNVYVYSM